MIRESKVLIDETKLMINFLKLKKRGSFLLLSENVILWEAFCHSNDRREEESCVHPRKHLRVYAPARKGLLRMDTIAEVHSK